MKTCSHRPGHSRRALLNIATMALAALVVAHTPPALVAKLNANLHAVLDSDDVEADMLKVGLTVSTSDPDQLAAPSRPTWRAGTRSSRPPASPPINIAPSNASLPEPKQRTP
jgi:hypothetical protein